MEEGEQDHLREILDSSWTAFRSGELPTPVDDAAVVAVFDSESSRNRERWANADAVPETARTIGVALSGGGSRAAAFDLGVLDYLVASGMARFVTSIASVSGGSLANAVALGSDFSRVTPEAWRQDLRRAARTLARGVVPRIAAASLVAAVAVICGAGAALALRLDGAARIASLAGVVAIALACFAGRGVAMEGFLGRRFANGSPAARWRSGTGRVAHVFCATDLVSGSQIHFAAPTARTYDAGWRRVNLPLRRALRASAAFPGLVPPATVRVGGRTLRLTDGGVSNNLGTDWYEKTADWAGERLPDLAAEFTEGVPGEAIDPDGLLVVDAGAPLRRRPARWLPPPLSDAAVLLRVMSILYENTVTPRRQALEDCLVIDEFAPRSVRDKVVRSRYTGASAVASIGAQHGSVGASLWWEAGGRAGNPGLGSRARAAHVWDRIFGSADTRLHQSIPTTFSPLGSSVVTSLLRHGYLAAMEALYVAYDAPIVEPPTIDELHEVLGMPPFLPRRVRRIIAMHERHDTRRFNELLDVATRTQSVGGESD